MPHPQRTHDGGTSREQSWASSLSFDSDDSMASDSDGESIPSSHASLKSKIWRGYESSKHTLSDSKERTEWKLGWKTKALCSACREIPFDGCIPTESSSSTAGDGDSGKVKGPSKLVYIRSLSKIAKHRGWCKLCGLLFRSVCQPAYDLFRAEHISKGLQQSEKLRDIKTFAQWAEEVPHWRREWGKAVDLWPFGLTVDWEQAARSTREQAERLFADTEFEDLNFKGLDEIANMYRTKAPEVLEKAHMLTFVWTYEKRIRRLPCIFVMRVYQMDEEKAGALSVRVYGHGRVPLAPLKEITHFSLRFETDIEPRRCKEQIWYGNQLSSRINVPFFAKCVDACQSLHAECGKVRWNSTPADFRARHRYGDAPFRLIDVHDRCLIEMDFEEIVGSDPHHVDYVTLSYTWGTPPLSEDWIEQTRIGQEGGSLETEYYNKKTRQTTSVRPVDQKNPAATRLTTDNESTLRSKNGLKEGSGIHIPQTIRDAIKIVKDIGKRYLWVDSLCIIQEEDSADTRANISRMGRIYHHALFTIVAADSEHADAGIQGIRRNRSTSGLIMEHGIVPNASLFLPVGLKDMEYRPWEDRAWCFQEKVLSRRLLVFAGGHAVWHCRGSTWREDVNAMDGDKSSVSFPWLRLTSIEPPNTTAFARAGLITMKEDESVRLTRLPAMDQYIQAVEDFSSRAIGESWKVLDAFEGLLNILECPELLDSPFRNGLPSSFLDVALLWQAQRPLRRRSDHIGDFGTILRRSPPSWSWAGWESAMSKGREAEEGLIHYEKPFDVECDERGLNKRLNILGEERIRPRKGTLYSVAGLKDEENIVQLGIFGLPNIDTEDFNGWQTGPEGQPMLPFPVGDLTDRHLILQTEVATLYLGREVWRKTTYTKLGDVQYCRESFHDKDPGKTVSERGIRPNQATSEPGMDLDSRTRVSHEYWVKFGSDENIGVVKVDAGFYQQGSVEAVILSEAQYLGNEKTVDGLGYPFYNVMLIERKGGGTFAERIGVGKVYKSAWRKLEPRSEVIVVE